MCWQKPDVFNRRTVLHYCADLDVDAMKKAAEYLKGEHDFMSFCSNKRTKKSTVRKIYDIEIIKDGDEISFIFKEMVSSTIWSEYLQAHLLKLVLEKLILKICQNLRG